MASFRLAGNKVSRPRMESDIKKEESDSHSLLHQTYGFNVVILGLLSAS